MSDHSIETQLALIHDKLELLLAQREDHEVRLRSLEKIKWAVLGLAVIAGPIATGLFNAAVQK